jgi:hypothetical protein
LDLDRLRNVGAVNCGRLTVAYVVSLRGRRLLGQSGQDANVTASARNGLVRNKRGDTGRFVAKAIPIIIHLGVLGISFAEIVTNNIMCSTVPDWPNCLHNILSPYYRGADFEVGQPSWFEVDCQFITRGPGSIMGRQ